MKPKTILLSGSLFAALGVALGAFGAHALKATLLANNRVDAYETAVRYQMIHALALLFLGLYAQQTGNRMAKTAYCWIIGTILFSGSLYGLSFASIGAFAYATPLGGLFFLAGWILLIVSLI